MNVQRHSRIEHIKQLSAHLRRALVFAQYVLWLGWPLFIAMAFFPDIPNFKTAIGGNSEPLSAMSTQMRALLVVNAMAILALTQLVVLYSRRLMEHFIEGHLFDGLSIATAKKAINSGLGLLALHVAGEIGGAFYLGKFQLPGPLMTAFYGFLFFGMLHVMLWALEIGRDLNEEAELTI